MARQRLTPHRPAPPAAAAEPARPAAPGELDRAAESVIECYLDNLAGHLPRYAPLPGGVADELRDHLLASTASRLPRSPDPATAARAAIAEFGDPPTIAESLRPELATRHARRVGLALLFTGPLVGGCWVLALVLVDAPLPWRWVLAVAAPLLLIGASAVGLTVAASGRLVRWLGGPVGPVAPVALASGAVAGLAAGAADLVLLGGSGMLLLLAPVSHPSWLLGLAAAASLTRLVLVGRAANRLRGARRPLATPPVTA